MNNKISLIIVDDHKMFLEGMKSLLSKENEITVLSVLDTAKKALAFLKNNTPDLLITDIAMPEMNGIEFIKIVKAQP